MLTPLRHPWTALNYPSAYSAYLFHRVEKVTLSLPPSQQVAFYKHGVKGAAGPLEKVPSPQVRPPAL